MAARYGTPTPLPAIPDSGATLEEALARLKETLEVWEGARGDGLDRVITVRDLLNAGIATEEAATTIYEAAGRSVPDSIPTVAPSPAVPPAPDGLVASATVQVVVLSWTFPEDYTRLAHFEVWRSTTTLLADAVLIGTPMMPTFTDDVGSAGSFYYWVRAVSDAGVSPFNSDAGTPGTATTAVQSLSVASANGFGGTVTSTTTPVITLTTDLTGLLKGDGTAMQAAQADTDYLAPGGALGTPASGNLANCTGLPVATGIAGLGTGMATFLATPNSANLRAALADESGNGAALFAGGTTTTLTYNGAGSTTVPQLDLAGATNNWMRFAGVGVAPPAFTTRSLGTKVVLYPTLSGTALDIGMGVESGYTWFSNNATSAGWKFYAGSTTPVVTFSGGGAITCKGLTSNGTGGIGYATGAGGAATQITSKATAVTINFPTGDITTHNALLNAGATVSFTLSNVRIVAADMIHVHHISGGNIGDYDVWGICAANAATIYIRNRTGAALSDALVLRFALMKTVSA